MRHKKKTEHLKRKSSHRKAMLSNMATSLIMHKRISTTVPKAKALRKYVEPLLTKAKDDSLHSRRIVFRYLQNKFAVSELFREVSPKIISRPGGYTRILKTGNRLGDNAEMCIIELVDYNENMLTVKETKAQEKAGKSRRRRSKKKSTEAAAETQTTEQAQQTPQQNEGPAEQTQAKNEKQTDAQTPETKQEKVQQEDVKQQEEKKEEPKDTSKVQDQKEDKKNQAPEQKQKKEEPKEKTQEKEVPENNETQNKKEEQEKKEDDKSEDDKK